jgi:hypothetical protein
MCTKLLLEILKGRDSFADLGAEQGIILNGSKRNKRVKKKL